jgi:SlyX protein
MPDKDKLMASSTEEKIIVLQEKILYQEDTLQKLDEVIARQYQLIDTLTRRLKEVEDKMDMLQDAMDKTPASIADEKPPHY